MKYLKSFGNGPEMNCYEILMMSIADYDNQLLMMRRRIIGRADAHIALYSCYASK